MVGWTISLDPNRAPIAWSYENQNLRIETGRHLVKQHPLPEQIVASPPCHCGASLQIDNVQQLRGGVRPGV